MLEARTFAPGQLQIALQHSCYLSYATRPKLTARLGASGKSKLRPQRELEMSRGDCGGHGRIEGR